MPENWFLQLSAVTDSVCITYLGKKKIKPLILTSHPTQEKVNCSPTGVNYSPLPAHSKCASTFPGETWRRKNSNAYWSLELE